jgi:hypothetical protein
MPSGTVTSNCHDSPERYSSLNGKAERLIGATVSCWNPSLSAGEVAMLDVGEARVGFEAVAFHSILALGAQVFGRPRAVRPNTSGLALPTPATVAQHYHLVTM